MSRAAAGLPWRRIAAWVVDWLVISVYAAALVPVGLLLVESSVRLSPLGWNAVSFVVLVLPATVWAASWERTRRGATPGKRLLGLRVRTQPGGRLSWGQAMARNSLKIAVPWEAGHTAAFLLADPGGGDVTIAIGMASAVIACAVAAVYVAALFIGEGRTLYDRAAATRVRARESPRRRPGPDPPRACG